MCVCNCSSGLVDKASLTVRVVPPPILAEDGSELVAGADLEDLAMTWRWRVNVDITVVTYDGNAVDACVLAAFTSLARTRLPAVSVLPSGRAVAIARTAEQLVHPSFATLRPVTSMSPLLLPERVATVGLPVPLTIAVIPIPAHTSPDAGHDEQIRDVEASLMSATPGCTVLPDPCLFEEDLAILRCTHLVMAPVPASTMDDMTPAARVPQILAMRHWGGSPMPQSVQDVARSLAEARAASLAADLHAAVGAQVPLPVLPTSADM